MSAILNKNMEITVARSPFSLGLDVLIHTRRMEGQHFAVAKTIEFQTYEDGTVIEPTFHLGGSREIQRLVDDLWQLGYRPTDFRDVNAQISGMDRHLSDMRKIAGKFLELDL